MEPELIRPIVRVGNSAGVILPKKWVNGRARVELISKPLDIKSDVFEILEPYLREIIGIYIVGSYARGEHTERSDVDILAITSKTNHVIDKGKYSIILINKDRLMVELKKNIMPFLPMLKEAKALLNSTFIEKYNSTEINKVNLEPYIELGKSILKVNRAAIDLDKNWPSDCEDAIAYSLVLRLRSSYILDCLIKEKKWNNREFIKIVKKVSGSIKAYEGYLRAKDDKPRKKGLPVEEAERLHDYVLKKIKEHEKWIKIKN